MYLPLSPRCSKPEDERFEGDESMMDSYINLDEMRIVNAPVCTIMESRSESVIMSLCSLFVYVYIRWWYWMRILA